MGAGASALEDTASASSSSSPVGSRVRARGPDYDSASDEQKALMAQAQAHWHRMIIHANSSGAAGSKPSALPPTSESEEERVQRTIAMYSAAERRVLEEREVEHKADEKEEKVNFDSFERDLAARLAPLDESTLISRSNSDIVLRRSASGDPLPINMPRTPTRSAAPSPSATASLSPLPSSSSSTATSSPPRPGTSSLVSSFLRQPRISPDCLHAISVLPPVRVDLRSRTSSSLSLVWDSDMQALIALRKVVDRSGIAIAPRYEVTYRLAPQEQQTDLEVLYDLSLQQDKKKKAAKWLWLSLDDVCKTSGVITGLEPNTQYCVRCRRMQWSEDWGVTVTVRTGPGPPAAVEAMHAKETSSSSVLVAWDPPLRDNGLPVLHYVVRMKRLGTEFKEEEGEGAKGKERLYLAVDLEPNTVYVFEVLACNRVGAGAAGARLATRTLQPGAPPMTPWMEAIESKTGKLFYRHPKTDACAWVLPKGSVLDAALSLQNKIAYLRERMRAMQEVARQAVPRDKQELRLTVRRGAVELLEDSLGALRVCSVEELLAGPVKVTFANEVGVDGGGLSREWAVEVAKALVSSSSGLFKMDDNGSGAVIDVRAETLHGSECRWLFAAIAKVFAKCLLDGLVLGVRFSMLFLSWLTGKPPSLEDLHTMDASMYRGLTWVLENDVAGLDLTFSASYELLDAQHTVDLVPGGRHQPVTNDSKREYVNLMMAWLIRGRFEPAVTHFVDSFHAVLPMALFDHFSLSELQLLVGGSEEVDIGLLQQEACYTGGYSQDSCCQLQWFWEILKQDLSGKEVSALLAFITGCPCVPHSGLKPPLTITMVEGEEGGGGDNSHVLNSGDSTTTSVLDKRDEILPRSHTCFHQIVMPLYSSKEKMTEKLLYALKNSDGGGFHLA